MTHALGPVVGNALQIQPDAPKPHLLERLRPWAENALGTVERDADGKLSFAPNYAGECPAAQPVVYREPAYVPKTDFGVAVEPVADAQAKSEPYQPKVGDRVIVAAASNFLPGREVTILKVDDDNTSFVRPDDGLSYWVFTPYLSPADVVAAAFDPMTEPLALGDYVEVVYRDESDASVHVHTGKRGKVAAFDRTCGTQLIYDDGTSEVGGPGWAHRSSLKLIRKAA